MTNLFTEHVESIETHYTADVILGRLTWYTVTEGTKMNHVEFCKRIIDIYEKIGAGIPPDLPPQPRAVDVFKRACTASQLKNIVPDLADVNTKMNFNVRPTGTDHDNVWRTIVREDVDNAGHSLGYTELVLINFQRSTETLTFKPVVDGAMDCEHVKGMVAYIQDYFKDESENLTAYFVREYVRKLLERDMSAIRVRNGVYFVGQEYAAGLDALETMVNGLGDDETNMHSLPLLDDGKQREMLRNAFEQESVGEVDRLLGEIAEIREKGTKIGQARYNAFYAEFEALTRKVADYSDLLDTALDLTGSRLEVMRDTMFALMDNVKVD